MFTILLLLGLGIGIAYVLYRQFPDTVRRVFYAVQRVRTTVFTLGYVATMLALLVSGIWYLMLVGMAMAGFGAWWYLEADLRVSEVLS